jgi:hypothetical protein
MSKKQKSERGKFSIKQKKIKTQKFRGDRPNQTTSKHTTWGLYFAVKAKLRERERILIVEV